MEAALGCFTMVNTAPQIFHTMVISSNIPRAAHTDLIMGDWSTSIWRRINKFPKSKTRLKSKIFSLERLWTLN